MISKITAGEDIKKGDSIFINSNNKAFKVVTTLYLGEKILERPVSINQIPNADILEVMKSFEDTLDIKLRPVDEQRRYAKFLINDYGKQKVLDGVQAIAAARGRPYSPSITSLKELHFKWGKLVDFYARQAPKQGNVSNLDNI